jgi:hypothetical protein
LEALFVKKLWKALHDPTRLHTVRKSATTLFGGREDRNCDVLVILFTLKTHDDAARRQIYIGWNID